MINIKHIAYLFIFFIGVFLCSCNKTDEPPMKQPLPIQEQFVIESCSIDTSNEYLMTQCSAFSRKCYVVNAIDDYPSDNLGFSEAYYNIDFSSYTVLLYYRLHTWELETYKYRYYYDQSNNSYNWLIQIGLGDNVDGILNYRIFSRFAIKVKKIPINSDIIANDEVYDI